MRKIVLAVAFAAAAVFFGLRLGAAEDKSNPMVKAGDRVVFVGDSITGLGINFGPDGFINLFKWALDGARPGSNVTVVSLGGSGQSVSSWAGVEKQSREKDTFLDVKNVNVKEELGKHADILVIMLGMNDTLAPYVGEDQQSLDAWAKNYKELIAALRERATPRITAIGTVTPNTEDPLSPKNLVIAEMNKRLAALSKELGCRLLQTNENVSEVLYQGRRFNPNFHVTTDFVHPNGAGHAAIAIGMLKGLGEEAAAERISKKNLEKFYSDAKGALPVFSYVLTPISIPLGSDQASFEISYQWIPSPADGKNSPKATLSIPEGWKSDPAELSGGKGTFKVSGTLDHLVNTVKICIKSKTAYKELPVNIPAPWLIGSGFINQKAWEHGTQKYIPSNGVLPGEEQLMNGAGFGKTPDGWTEAPPKWTRYLANVDCTGGATPGSVCMYAVTYSSVFEGAFGARWISSDKDLPVKIAIGTQTFAGSIGLCVSLNGERIYAGTINSEPERKVEKDVILKKGLNCLAFKANHCTWQWQFSIDMTSEKPEDLAGLRVTTVPPAKE